MTDIDAFDADLVRLGARVREVRKAAGISQQAVADALGVHRTTINRFEGGVQDLGASRLVGLARVLGVSPSELLNFGS